MLRFSRLMRFNGDNLTAIITAYGAALGAASVPIALLARPDPRLHLPEHMSLAPTVYLAMAGAVAGMLLTWPIVRKLPEMVGEYRGWVTWLIFGVGYALFLPFVTGVLLPLSVVFLNVQIGIIALREVPSEILASAFRAPLQSFVYAVLSLYTGAIAGILFAIGGFAIDELGHSRNALVHRYVPWAIALAVGITTIAFANLAPASTVAKFG